MRTAWVVAGAVLWAAQAGAQAPPARPGMPGWVRGNPGCFIWSPDPQEDETAEWTGACLNARATGTGTILWRVAGEVSGRFHGVMRDGRAEGTGVFDWPDRRHYAGAFHDGRIEGEGVLTWPNGDRYFGHFLAGRRHGHGVQSWGNGQRYEGDFQQDAITGRGVLTIPGGRYSGELRDGIPDGYGILISPAGNFGGNWHSGCFNDGMHRVAIGVVPSECP